MAITVTHTKVSTIPDGDDSSLIRPSDWNDTHTLTGLGTMAEQNANAVAITGGTMSGVAITGYIPTTQKGAANGVATLDSGGKVPISELPAAVIGALSYQGTWNASTNTPTLTSSTGTKGYYYVVSVAGSTDLDGITDWVVGDWAVFNGTVWQQIDNTDAVTSVNGLTGAVVLTTTNIAEGTNEYFTTAKARASVSAGTAISYDNSTGVITNSAPDQVVALTGAGTTTVTGTYPNFTITSNDQFDGDVVGPSSATDNAIARFDTTTGKLIQNSVVTIDDAGNEAGINSISFDTTPTTVPTTPGSLYWDSANGNQTLSLVMANGDATQQIGEETYFRIRASAAITEGQVVMFTGTIGGSGALTGAPASGLTATTASYVMGIATHNLAINDWGYITSFGLVRGIDTTGGAEAWVDGQILYYNPSVAGGLTKTVPVAPNAKIQVCAVVNAASGGSGSVFVRPTFGGALGQYEGDVQVTTPANGDLLIRNQTTGEWINAPLTAGTAISVTNTAGAVSIANTAPDQTVSIASGTGISATGTYPNFTVTNTAPDQTVALSNGTGISVTGTYPNFTITNTAPSSGGTVTSVSGTAPIASTGGTTPAISISQATTSTDGYLSSTDWNTFNGKQAALTSGTNIKTVSGTSLLGSGDVGTIGVGYGGTGTATAFTAGSLVFAGASGTYSQDNANLFWDDTNNRLGIGVNNPAIKLDLQGTGTDTLFRALNTGTAASDDSILIVQTSGTGTTSTISGLFFGDGDSQSIGQLRYNHSNDSMVFYTNSTIAFTISSAGGISIVRTAVTAPAASDGNVFSGTYTPSLTNTTNIASSTATTCQYMRVGSVVTVSGQVTVDATTAGVATVLRMSLPIASSFGASAQLGGAGASFTSGAYGNSMCIFADTSASTAEFRWLPTLATAQGYNFSFTYQVI